MMKAEEKDKFVVVVRKPNNFTEKNKKIFEFNKKKHFTFFKSSKKVVLPSIFVTD